MFKFLSQMMSNSDATYESTISQLLGPIAHGPARAITRNHAIVQPQESTTVDDELTVWGVVAGIRLILNGMKTLNNTVVDINECQGRDSVRINALESRVLELEHELKAREEEAKAAKRKKPVVIERRKTRERNEEA